MKLSLEDCIEMRESYIYFKEIGHKISVPDFARMYDCSVATAKRAITGTHPAYGKDTTEFDKPKRPVGRPRKNPVV